jgi:hemerythrin superfamily protein
MATNSEDKPRTAPRRKATPQKREADTGGTTALWGAAAAGVAVGVAAMIGRKVAVQAPTALAGDWDVALAAEHKAVLKIFDTLEETTSKNTAKRTLLLSQLKHALAKHALQEENTIYPALRDAGKTEEADGLNKDHGYVKQYLYELDNCPKDSDTFLSIVRRFRTDLEKHVREEEEELFPGLKAQLSPEANKKLTFAMNREGFKLA